MGRSENTRELIASFSTRNSLEGIWWLEEILKFLGSAGGLFPEGPGWGTEGLESLGAV